MNQFVLLLGVKSVLLDVAYGCQFVLKALEERGELEQLWIVLPFFSIDFVSYDGVNMISGQAIVMHTSYKCSPARLFIFLIPNLLVLVIFDHLLEN